jgi:hypothetical protein
MATNGTDFYTNQKAAAVNKALSVVPFNPITSLPPLKGDISINGLTLNSVDANGVVWVVTDITNWWQPASAEIPDVPRGLDDGSYDVRGRWVARSMELKGSILVPDSSYVEVARKKLIDTFNLVYTGAWLTVNESTPKTAYVRLNGQMEIENVNARGRINFVVPLKAADPLKYDWDTDDTTYGYTAYGFYNLLTNPNFETNSTGWTANGGTLSTTTAAKYNGTSAAILTVDATGVTNAYATIATPSGTSAYKLTLPGNVYTFSAYVRSAATPRSAVANIQWYDSAGTSISTSTTSTAITTSTSTWTRVSVTAAAPATAAYGRPYVTYSGALVLNEVHYLDACLFHQATSVYPYFDSTTAVSATLNNLGNANTSMLINLVGPLTAPAYITNSTTNKTIKIVSNLRDSTYSKNTVNNGNIYGGIATLTTSAAHGFLAGDYVSISGSTTGYNQSNVAITAVTSTTISYKSPLPLTVSSVVVTSNVAVVTTTTAHGLTTSDSVYLESASNPVLNGIYAITAVTTSSPYTFSFARSIDNTSTTDATVYKQISSASAAGTISLLNADTMTIDTYNSSVSFRGLPDSSRSTLSANTDWIKIQPGNNVFTVNYASGSPTVVAKYRSAWIG